MLQQNGYDEFVVARLLEFFARRTPWQRRLWVIGAVAAIEEILETSQGVAASAIDISALRKLQNEASSRYGGDPGLGDQQTKQALIKLLRADSDLLPGRPPWHTLREMIPLLREGYLTRWAIKIRTDGLGLGAERTARLLAGHLLGTGYSPDYLHRWLTFQAVHRPETVGLADLLDEAESSLLQRPEQLYEVVLPCRAAPRAAVAAAGADSWCDAPTIAKKIEEIAGERHSLRQYGGFSLQIQARDPDSAVEHALDRVGRWTARLELATNRTIELTGQAWVSGLVTPIPTNRVRRGVDVGTLERENMIYASLDGEMSQRLDDALQLLQPLETGPRAAAIGGGWAAIESLLVAPGENPKSLAASRLAAIVACSYPRAELTTLAYAHKQHANDDLAVAISDREAQNLDRARLVAAALKEGHPVAGHSFGHQAAIRRMNEVLLTPNETLSKVRQYVESALLRLYRNRNLALHGGRVAGPGRTAVLFTTPPLVGAGIDRIAHAFFREQIGPLELSGRSDLRLELLGTGAGRPVTELLER